MTHRLRTSITLKMTLLVAGGTVLVFSCILAYGYTYSRKLILAEAEQNARNLTLSVARRLEQEFRAVEKVPENLASVLETTPCCDRQTLEPLLQRVVEVNREVYGSAVAFEPYAFQPGIEAYAPYYYKTGHGIAFVQLATDSYRYFRQDWYHEPKVLKAPVWTEPYFDEGGANAIMTTYSVPFWDRSAGGNAAKLRGIVTADISLEWLAELLASIKVARTGFCMVISGTGRFVSHPKAELVMRESLFSIAEERNEPLLQHVGRSMIREEAGFVDIGTGLTPNRAFLAYARIPSTGWSLATVIPAEELLEELTRLHRDTVSMAVFGVILLFAVSLLVARSLSRPLRRMAQVVDRVGEGDLDVDLSSVRSTDEVGQLARAFEHMAEGLKERDFIRDTFGRYVAREVVKKLLDSKDGLKLGGETREISMIMSDLRGFTALSANMEPAQVITFLNRYLGRMVEILLDHHATIDEIIGDGILAFFGAPGLMEDHPERAVACALRMQLALEEINRLNEADGLPYLEMGIAVNTGTVVVGNIGSEKRSKYGAVGQQINFTGRIESFTIGGQVLISDSTYQRLRDIVAVRNSFQVEMKGIPGKVTLYDVRGLSGAYSVNLPERDEGPQPLKDRLAVQVQRVEQKTVIGTEPTAWITAVSATSALLVVDNPIGEFENLKLLLLDEKREPTGGEIYGKVLSVVERQDGSHEARVRFTSVSGAAVKSLREALAVLAETGVPGRVVDPSSGAA